MVALTERQVLVFVASCAHSLWFAGATLEKKEKKKEEWKAGGGLRTYGEQLRTDFDCEQRLADAARHALQSE